jgi:syntaxin 16
VVIPKELQGHAIKNKDLLAASGAITLKGPESLDELEEDVQAVGLDSVGVAFARS